MNDFRSLSKATMGLLAILAIALCLLALVPALAMVTVFGEVIGPTWALISPEAPRAVINAATTIPAVDRALVTITALAAAALLTILALRQWRRSGAPTGSLTNLYVLNQGDDGPSYSDPLGRPPDDQRFTIKSVLGLGGHRPRDQSRGRSTVEIC